LGERIGANAKLAAVLGFGGVIVVVGGEVLSVGPDGDLLGMGAVLLSAVMYAFNLILQRMQALIAKPLEIAFYQNIIVFVIYYWRHRLQRHYRPMRCNGVALH
jgi:S-adenosylmethionine uptake transporter